jgi:hypothetical protein
MRSPGHGPRRCREGWLGLSWDTAPSGAVHQLRDMLWGVEGTNRDSTRNDPNEAVDLSLVFLKRTEHQPR